MPILIWGGAAVSVIGLIGLIISILKVSKAKKTTARSREKGRAAEYGRPIAINLWFDDGHFGNIFEIILGKYRTLNIFT